MVDCFICFIYLFCRSTVHPASPPLLCTQEDVEVAESPLRILAETPDSFEKHIRSILQRSVANPAFLKYGVWVIGFKNWFPYVFPITVHTLCSQLLISFYVFFTTLELEETQGIFKQLVNSQKLENDKQQV